MTEYRRDRKLALLRVPHHDLGVDVILSLASSVKNALGRSNMFLGRSPTETQTVCQLREDRLLSERANSQRIRRCSNRRG